jgi:RNA polymerase sigma-70 factor (ECF subfamily)
LNAPNTYPETELLQLIADGNEAAFRQLYDQHRDRIYSFSLQLLQREDLAEELVQDVFLKIWTSRAALVDVENIGGFLYTVARNLSLSRLKRIAHEQQIVREIGKRSTESNLTDDEVLHRDYQKLLQEAIANLSAQQRTVYVMSKEKGMSRQEIADELELSPNTVKAHLSAATTALRDWFARHKGEMLALFIVLHGYK